MTTYPPLISYLTVNDASKAIEFYKAAFGATERYRLSAPDSGKVGHSELDLNGSMIMVADENPAFCKSPTTLGGTPVKFCLMVENADTALDLATAAGATLQMPATDMFYGYRCGSVRDPFGHEWMIQHELEKVSSEEMQKRWTAMLGKCPEA